MDIKDTRIPEFIAEVCHNVNKAYCESIGDTSQPTWADAPLWQRNSAIQGVYFHLEADREPSESHHHWVRDKLNEGWVYGEVKDSKAKTHPCIVHYNELPVEQKTKDYLFKAVVDTYKGANKR